MECSIMRCDRFIFSRGIVENWILFFFVIVNQFEKIWYIKYIDCIIWFKASRAAKGKYILRKYAVRFVIQSNVYWHLDNILFPYQCRMMLDFVFNIEMKSIGHSLMIHKTLSLDDCISHFTSFPSKIFGNKKKK